MAPKDKPIITQGHTSTIDNMTKLCVLGKYWDDVITRGLPDVWLRRGEFKASEVSQKKYKLGLGELYEQEYLKKSMILDAEDKEK